MSAPMLSDTDLAEAIKQARATPGVAYVIPLDDEYVATVAIVKCPSPKLSPQVAAARAEKAARNGSLDTLRELHRNGDLQPRSLLQDAFWMACCHGHLATAQWIHETFKLTQEDARSHDNLALRRACFNDKLDVARWLWETFKLTTEDARACNNETFHVACSQGDLDVARWLYETFKLTPEDARSYDNLVLRRACFNRQLTMAKWLVETFGLTAADARADKNLAFRVACRQGHLDVARWLWETFKLTPEDARACDGEALKRARENGHRGVVEWLENEVFATPKPMSEAPRHVVFMACREGNLAGLQELHAAKVLTEDVVVKYGALFIACNHGQTATAQWLVETFPSIAKTPVDCLLQPLEQISARGFLETLKWFCNTFPQLTREFFVHNDKNESGACYALQEACTHGHLEVAKHLTEHYGLTADHARANDNEALRKACGPKGSLEVVQWLYERFSLTSQELKAAVGRAKMFDGVRLNVADWAQHIEMVDNMNALRDACVVGQFEVIKAMRSRLTPTAVRVADALTLACIHGHLPVARWLREEFKLDATDAKCSLEATIKGAVANGHADAVLWIVEMANSGC